MKTSVFEANLLLLELLRLREEIRQAKVMHREAEEKLARLLNEGEWLIGSYLISVEHTGGTGARWAVSFRELSRPMLSPHPSDCLTESDLDAPASDSESNH